MKPIYKCIATRIVPRNKDGVVWDSFVLDLYCKETGKTVSRWLNCYKTPKGNYAVKHNSDFAKLYRLVFGKNPSKRFSKAHQLLPHFTGELFHVAEPIPAICKKTGMPYLKTSHIEPVSPILTDEWTEDGRLIPSKKGKKQSRTQKKAGDGKSLEAANSVVLKPISITVNEVVTTRLQDGDEEATTRLHDGDDKTLQTAKTLGLEVDFNHAKKLSFSSEKAYTLTPVISESKIIDSDLRENILEFYEEANSLALKPISITVDESINQTGLHAPISLKFFNLKTAFPQHEDESTDEYFDRIIFETNPFNEIADEEF